MMSTAEEEGGSGEVGPSTIAESSGDQRSGKGGNVEADSGTTGGVAESKAEEEAACVGAAAADRIRRKTSVAYASHGEGV